MLPFLVLGLAQLALGLPSELPAKVRHYAPVGNFTLHAPTREAARELLQQNGVNITIMDPEHLNRILNASKSLTVLDAKLDERDSGGTNCDRCKISVSGFDFAIVDLYVDLYNPATAGWGSVGSQKDYLVSAAQGATSPECLPQSSISFSGYGNWYDMCHNNAYVGTQPNTNNWIHVSYCDGGGYDWNTKPSVIYLNWSWGESFGYCYPSDFGQYCSDNGDFMETFKTSTVAWCNWY